jgi:hypothetical protein
MVLFAAMLQVVVAAPMVAMAATWQHPPLRERVLHTLQELPINEA